MPSPSIPTYRRDDGRTPWTIAIVLLTLALVALSPPRSVASSSQEASGRCPYGHEELGTVPLEVGSDLRWGLECRRCGARDFRLVDEDERDRDPFWSRDSMDPDSFELPLHELIRNFPVVDPAAANSPTYGQMFERGALWYEGLFYSSSAEHEDIVVQVLDFLDGFSMPYALTAESSTSVKLAVDDPGHATSVSVWCPGGHCLVAVVRRWDPNELPSSPRMAGAGVELATE